MDKHIHIYLTNDDWAAWNAQHKGDHHPTHAAAHAALGARHKELEKAGFVHHRSEGHPDEDGGHTNHLKHANGSTAKVVHIAHPQNSGGGHHVSATVKEKESHKAPKAPAPKREMPSRGSRTATHGGKGAKHIFVALKKGAKEVGREVEKHERTVGKK